MNVINQEKYEIAYIKRNTNLVIDLMETLFEEKQTFSSFTKEPMTRNEIIESLTRLSNANLEKFTIEQLVSCRKVLSELLVLSWEHREILISKCYMLLPNEDDSFYVSGVKLANKLLEDFIIDAKSLLEYMTIYKILTFHKKMMSDV